MQKWFKNLFKISSYSIGINTRTTETKETKSTLMQISQVENYTIFLN